LSKTVDTYSIGISSEALSRAIQLMADKILCPMPGRRRKVGSFPFGQGARPSMEWPGHGFHTIYLFQVKSGIIYIFQFP
jgi:hypothetical protein